MEILLDSSEFLGLIEQVGSQIDEAIEGTAYRLTPRVRDDVREGTPIVTGRLWRSIVFSVEGEGANTEGIVVSDCPYAPIVEERHGMFKSGASKVAALWFDEFFTLVSEYLARAKT